MPVEWVMFPLETVCEPEVTCYLCCRGHVIMFTSPDTFSSDHHKLSSHLRLCLLRVSALLHQRFVLVSSCLCPMLEAPPPPTHSVTQWRILCCVHTAPGFRLYTGAHSECDPPEKIQRTEELSLKAASLLFPPSLFCSLPPLISIRFHPSPLSKFNQGLMNALISDSVKYSSIEVDAPMLPVVQ